MSRPDRDPLAGAGRLLIDGSNLLHAMTRGSGTIDGSAGAVRSHPPLPPAALIGRLRAVVPPAVQIVLVLDGPPDAGLGNRRLTSGVEVRHSGRSSADRLILDLLAMTPDDTLVVTDDGDLARAARAGGAGHVRAAWLVARLGRQRLSGPAIGPRRPAQTDPANRSEPGAPEDGARERGAWRPGRGATRKVGNPRRAGRRP